MLFPDAGGAGSTEAKPLNSSTPSTDADALVAMRERERQMMELLGTKSPERLLHDLRNVLNEVTLLRAVLEDNQS